MNTPLWDNNPWVELPSLQHDTKADVCVIGLGGSGLTCIHELLRLGIKDIVGIDASMVAGGAAGRNGGFLLAGTAKFYHESVLQLGERQAKNIYQLTLDEISRMRLQTPAAIRATGSLRVATTQEEQQDCLTQQTAMQADGFKAETYSGSEGTGLLFPDDCAMNPLLRVRELAKQAIALTAKLYEQTPALEISSGFIKTPSAKINCQHVIVCVDGQIEKIFPELAGIARTTRLQMLGTAATTELSIPRPVYARWGYEYWQQLPGGQVVLGGFRDHAENEEWTHNNQTSEKIQNLLEHFLRQHLKILAPISHRWAASVAYTETGLPIFNEVRAGVHVLGAYSGTGNVVGALLGRAAAQIVVNGKSEIASAFGY